MLCWGKCTIRIMILNCRVLEEYMHIKDYVTRIAGWELHDDDDLKFRYLGNISAIVFSRWLSVVIVACKCSCTKGSCLAITCSFHKFWLQSGARGFARLRSLTLEELRNVLGMPDPKRLRSQIRGSLALMLSEALDMWCFQVAVSYWNTAFLPLYR